MTNKMIMKSNCRILANLTLACVLLTGGLALASDDPLPSWNDTGAKKAIVEFVGRVTKEGSPDFVKPEVRATARD